MDRPIELTVSVVYVAAYVAVCAGLLVMLFPGARGAVQRSAAQQVYAWRRGLWLARQSPTPRWVALLATDDLPSEP
jgi:hypothetical protein